MKRGFIFGAIGLLIGAVAGYVYWSEWGCTESCAIRSVWWRSALWMGAIGLFGALSIESVLPSGKPGSENEDGGSDS